MAVHNHVIFPGVCPPCSFAGEFEAEIHFGDVALKHLVPGEHVDPPPHTHLTGPETVDGYVVCPSCEKDFWLEVFFEATLLTGFKLQTQRPGYL